MTGLETISCASCGARHAESRCPACGRVERGYPIEPRQPPPMVMRAPGGASHVLHEAAMMTLCGRVLRDAREVIGQPPSCKVCRAAWNREHNAAQARSAQERAAAVICEAAELRDPAPEKATQRWEKALEYALALQEHDMLLTDSSLLSLDEPAIMMRMALMDVTVAAYQAVLTASPVNRQRSARMLKPKLGDYCIALDARRSDPERYRGFGRLVEGPDYSSEDGCWFRLQYGPHERDVVLWSDATAIAVPLGDPDWWRWQG